MGTTMSARSRYYLTTAINYTNGLPHMGHAYEAVIADVLTRYHRSFGRNVFFLTGTDEHGQKIAQTAASDAWNCSPQELCDHFANAFQTLNRRLSINNDYYVRTSSDVHKETARALWRKAREAGDIYLSEYEGWYNTREETYVTEKEAEATGFKDPVSGKDLTLMKECSYFFKMSKYQTQLIEHINAHPEFIQPEFRKNEILGRLSEPLLDLCISRTKFSWGVPVPSNDDGTNDHEAHVMYVWFDALSNYLTGIDYFHHRPDVKDSEGVHLSAFWPANVHLIGKDIMWFHCVIWPTILMSCNIPLPKAVVCHGFVNAADGKKMSKSLGNVVDPNDCLDLVGNDSFRYFVMQAAKLGEDFPFVREQMFDIHNAILNDQLGNLIHRATNMTQKYCEGVTPSHSSRDAAVMDSFPAPFNPSTVVARLEGCLAKHQTQEALEAVTNAVRETNKFLQDSKPWDKERSEEERQVIMRRVLCAIHAIGHLIEPFIPTAGQTIITKLGGHRVPLETFLVAEDAHTILPSGLPVTVGEPLFTKTKDPQVAAAEEAAAASAAAAKAAKEKKKAEAASTTTFASKEDRKAAKAARRAERIAAGGDEKGEDKDE
eukprot:GDKK01058482.1.p1 GENE.GDKK01058482.1~~GDKK01058482.1.p1  ORF type:complete len:602 (+),score=182.55 GDKK01058482.1:1-1806(+)